jgi:L-cysteine desulfidase
MTGLHSGINPFAINKALWYDLLRIDADFSNCERVMPLMELYEKIIRREESISVVGLGYVGLPIAVAFARKANVIGFDVNEEKIAQYIAGIDTTREVGTISSEIHRSCSRPMRSSLKTPGFISSPCRRR